MSNYIMKTKNPDSGHWEMAEWLDDYFGSHHYGVRFLDGTVIDPEEVDLETDDEPEEASAQTMTDEPKQERNDV